MCVGEKIYIFETRKDILIPLFGRPVILWQNRSVVALRRRVSHESFSCTFPTSLSGRHVLLPGGLMVRTLTILLVVSVNTADPNNQPL